MIKIALIEDHHIVLDGIKQLLSQYSNFELTWIAHSQTEAINLFRENIPDIIVSDIQLPDGSGYDIAKHILSEVPQIKFIFLSMFFEPQYIYKSIEIGVMGYLTKESTVEELAVAIDKVYAGENYYGQKVVKNLLINQNKKKKNMDLKQLLSAREMEILALIYEGLNTKEIADKLFLSDKTVANHKLNIMSKLNVTNAVQLVKLYISFLEEHAG